MSDQTGSSPGTAPQPGPPAGGMSTVPADGGPVEVPPVDEHTRVEQAAATAGAERRPSWVTGRFADVRNLGLVGVLVILAIVGVLTTDGRFLTTNNILNILVSASIIGVVTVGMTVVMIMCALLVGMGAGLVNGVLVAYGGLVAFIVTLAMLVSARGLAQQMSDRRTQLVTVDAINDIATTEILGISLLVYIFAAVVAVGWLVLNRTTFGRWTFAVGGNLEAARLAGINVRRHTALLYVVSGLCCGIAAVMIMARTTTGSSTHGDLYELDAIAAVIIGGTLLTGGRGTLIGSVLGVLVFTTITNLL